MFISHSFVIVNVLNAETTLQERMRRLRWLIIQLFDLSVQSHLDSCSMVIWMDSDCHSVIQHKSTTKFIIIIIRSKVFYHPFENIVTVV